MFLQSRKMTEENKTTETLVKIGDERSFLKLQLKEYSRINVQKTSRFLEIH